MIIKNVYYFCRCWIADIIFGLCNKQLKDLILKDARTFVDYKSNLLTLNRALMDYPFRSIFAYRTKDKGKILKVLSYINQILLPCCKSVEINGGQFGGGLRIVHNHCVIHADVVGENLKVGPGVVIGKNNGGRPTIGNNVTIAAGAIVVGNIHIGDNSIIGAGALVMKDVPSNSVYVGNPAFLLRKI